MKRGPRRWLRSLQRFLEIEAASGILLAAATVAALAWANSPWFGSYFGWLEHPLGTVAGHALTPHWVIDDVLMTVFFFVVGLEIRRELSLGELSEPRRAALPAIAALGGMVAPACAYLAIAGAASTRSGWGVPTATDIAFALGVLSLLGRRVPGALRVLLLALAVIDDLGAIVVIAVFYTHGLRLEGLALAAAALVTVLVMLRARVREPFFYAVPGLALWAGLAFAGIHPTIAGVVLGLVTPVTSEGDGPSPSERFIALLHPYVAFGIMPIFALANAGVRVGAVALEPPELAVIGGVVLGLVLGKPVGIALACAIAVRANVGTLPAGLGARHVVVLGLVGGVGFTMALFVAALAFEDAALLGAARLAVLGGSALAAVIALAVGRALLPLPEADRA